MARLGGRDVARALREMAGLLDLEGESPYRARAYERAARIVERLDVDLPALVAGRRLTGLPGIGPRLAAVIAELHVTGRSQTLEARRDRLPTGAAELGRVPGLGLGVVAALSAAGIDTLAKLRAACESGQARRVKGIGERTERRLLEKIRRLERPAPRECLLPEALDLGRALLAHAGRAPGVTACDLAGGVRRWTETVDRLVLVLAATRPAAAVAHALNTLGAREFARAVSPAGRS